MPTTVEKPYEDVLIGVRQAITALEKKVQRTLLNGEGLLSVDDGGVTHFVATSSAGGGLQILVGGVIKTMTAESATKAALGAGAIVMDVLATDDGRSELDKIRQIQRLRPDMILLSGGTDGGNSQHVTSLAEMVALANPKSRSGQGHKLPVVFAGNTKARAQVDNFLGNMTVLNHVANLRPFLEEEVLEPASEEIHRLFLEHVMSQAPGYENLLQWAQGKVVPTPSAVGDLVKTIGESNDINVMTVDIGGATTDVFSSFLTLKQITEGKEGGKSKAFTQGYTRHYMKEVRVFHRSVAANLGMSYSIGNVLAESGAQNILRWLPYDIAEADLRDWLCNKMLRPTVIPQTPAAVLLEQAVAKEAIRLALQRHNAVASGLKGVSFKRGVHEIFDQKQMGFQTVIKSMELDVIIGSGGVLSHAPLRQQALLILLDAFEPQGITELYADSVFMMPHLGVMAGLDIEKCLDVLKRDCLISLGTCIAPVGPAAKEGKPIAKVRVTGSSETLYVTAGQLSCVPLAAEEQVNIRVTPAPSYDCGEGPGRPVESLATGGVGGLILDGRGRPLNLASTTTVRVQQLMAWAKAVGAYSPRFLEEVEAQWH